MRVPRADGTLVATPEVPDNAMVPSLLALSDVMSTGHHCAVSAGVGPVRSVVIVGDGAVGLSAVLTARRLGAERVVAMSRHASRQAVATAFGATDLVEERGDEGVARVTELVGEIGADCVLECVGTKESMQSRLVGCGLHRLERRPGGRRGRGRRGRGRRGRGRRDVLSDLARRPPVSR